MSGTPARPCRLCAVEHHLASGEGNLTDAVSVDFSKMTLQGDSYASEAYRRNRLDILIERTVHEFQDAQRDP